MKLGELETILTPLRCACEYGTIASGHVTGVERKYFEELMISRLRQAAENAGLIVKDGAQ